MGASTVLGRISSLARRFESVTHDKLIARGSSLPPTVASSSSSPVPPAELPLPTPPSLVDELLSLHIPENVVDEVSQTYCRAASELQTQFRAMYRSVHGKLLAPQSTADLHARVQLRATVISEYTVHLEKLRRETLASVQRSVSEATLLPADDTAQRSFNLVRRYSPSLCTLP
jgi:hypothetical protein